MKRKAKIIKKFLIIRNFNLMKFFRPVAAHNHGVSSAHFGLLSFSSMCSTSNSEKPTKLSAKLSNGEDVVCLAINLSKLPAI